MSTLGLTVRDLWCLLRERRPGDALAVVGDIARQRFYLTTEQVVVRKDMVADAGPATSAVRIEEATGDHLPLLAEFNRRQCNRRRTQTFANGLADGRRALLGFRGDELIGYFWWHDATHTGDDFYLARFGLGLAEGDMYGYDLFIAPDHRGHGTPDAFLAAVEAELVRLGYHRMFGFVDSANRPARWLYACHGYEDVLRGRTRTVLRRLRRVEGRGWVVAGKGT